MEHPLLLLAKSDEADYPFALFFFGPMVFFVLYYFFLKARTTSAWDKGIFPENLPPTRDNLLEAYICLAARMIQSDTVDAGDKVLFMRKYFIQHFTESAYNFGDSLNFSYRNPIDIKTVAHWLNINIKKRSERLQIMYFLAGLSMVDGDMNAREMKLLREMSDLLKLTSDEFYSILSMYRASRERKNSASSGAATKASIRKLCCEILGVAENATMDMVKKAYRSLVKLHHPDKFSQHSEEQQKLAAKRFLEIQKAYETLENLA